jgi:hypothetical protein
VLGQINFAHASGSEALFELVLAQPACGQDFLTQDFVGEVLVRGLSMPHSPRWHDGRLWLLESGTGRLLSVDVATRRGEPVADLPGFARGLAGFQKEAVQHTFVVPRA